MKDIKSKLFLFVFVLTSAILAWGVWNNYKPQIVYASCSDIAYKSSTITKRYNIEDSSVNRYDSYYNDCLKEAGLKK